MGREEGIYGLEARVAEEVKAREGDGFVDAIYGGEGERAGETGGRARVVGRGSGGLIIITRAVFTHTGVPTKRKARS